MKATRPCCRPAAFAISGRTTGVVAGVALALVAVVAVAVLWPGKPGTNSEVLFEPPSRQTESAPLCPWREPETDIAAFFPGADRRESATLILSERRLELARELGRPPTGDENALRVHRILRDRELMGTILVERVKGEHGAIELVLAVTPEGTVQGVKVQRHREPPEVEAILTGEGWLQQFKGRNLHDLQGSPQGFTSLPEAVRPSAKAVGEGIRCALVLLAMAQHRSVSHDHGAGRARFQR